MIVVIDIALTKSCCVSMTFCIMVGVIPWVLTDAHVLAYMDDVQWVLLCLLVSTDHTGADV